MAAVMPSVSSVRRWMPTLPYIATAFILNIGRASVRYAVINLES